MKTFWHPRGKKIEIAIKVRISQSYVLVPCSIECVVSSNVLYMILSNENPWYCLKRTFTLLIKFTHRTQNTYILHKHRHRIWNALHNLYKKPFNPLLWSLIITYKTPGSIIISCLVKGKNNVESAETILTRILASVMDNREKVSNLTPRIDLIF